MTLEQVREKIRVLEETCPGNTETNVSSVSVDATPHPNFTGLDTIVNFRLRDVLCVKTVVVDETSTKPDKFPKTRTESQQVPSTDLPDDMCKLISLIETRNAYWKVDGNWKPDWKSPGAKYTLFNYRGTVDYGSREFDPCVLAFRTPEIRDKFYKNFRDLVESCKDYI